MQTSYLSNLKRQGPPVGEGNYWALLFKKTPIFISRKREGGDTCNFKFANLKLQGPKQAFKLLARRLYLPPTKLRVARKREPHRYVEFSGH
jgi:hypothetical protein